MGRAARVRGYALDPIPPEGVGIGAGCPRPGLCPGPISAGGHGCRGGLPATRADALDPFPPGGVGVGAGSPRPGLTPWTQLRRRWRVVGRAPRVRGWMAGGVSCEKKTQNPCRAGGDRATNGARRPAGMFHVGQRFPPPSPEFPKIHAKKPQKKSLQLAWGCAIIQKLEYAGSRGRLHALKRRVTTGRAETSSLTKRGPMRPCGGLGCASLSLRGRVQLQEPLRLKRAHYMEV